MPDPLIFNALMGLSIGLSGEPALTFGFRWKD
jgi:hypothetical protein